MVQTNNDSKRTSNYLFLFFANAIAIICIGIDLFPVWRQAIT